MNAAELNDARREMDPPMVGPDYEFGAPDTFRMDSRAVARRAIYLAWTYREMWENFAFPVGRDAAAHVAELGVLFLEIIGGDMHELYDAAERPLPPPPEEFRPKREADWIVPPHMKTGDDLLRARQNAVRREHPHFESAEEVKRAFDLLQAEKSREAGAIPLDDSGRPIP